GGYYAYKEEFVRAWEQFAANPSYETALKFLEGAPEYASTVFNFFVGSVPGGLYYRPAIKTAMDFEVGDYHLGMQLRDIKQLKELTEGEYGVFGRESLQDV